MTMVALTAAATLVAGVFSGVTGAPQPARRFAGPATEPVVAAGGGAGSVLGAIRRTRYRTIRSRKIVNGVRLLRIRDKRGPQRIFVLRVDQHSWPSAEVALSNEDLKGFETTSSMGKRYGGVAAINGDFGDLRSRWIGRPMHDFARDGAVDQRIGKWQNADPIIALSRSERVYMDTQKRVNLDLLLPEPSDASDVVKPIRRWNDGDPQGEELALYSAVGRNISRPPTDGYCSARLKEAGPPRWREGFDGVQLEYEVVDTYCPPVTGDPNVDQPVALPDSNHVVLSARAPEDLTDENPITSLPPRV
ncbi:MAG TPA: hypothetical protein VEA19_07830, partial [Actinomycetota bacterium]|nr:hypothetical protein [Actinomycetota bacterium]